MRHTPHEAKVAPFSQVGIYAPTGSANLYLTHTGQALAEKQAATKPRRPMERSQVFIGQVKIGRQNPGDEHRARDETGNVPGNFSGRGKLVVGLEPNGTAEPGSQKRKRDQAVVETILGKRCAQGGQKRETIGTKQIRRQVPHHHQSAKGEPCEKKAPKVDLAVVFRRKHKVVHPEKTAHHPGTEQDKDGPQQQQHQVIAKMQYQKPERKREVDLSEYGHGVLGAIDQERKDAGKRLSNVGIPGDFS